MDDSTWNDGIRCRTGDLVGGAVHLEIDKMPKMEVSSFNAQPACFLRFLEKVKKWQKSTFFWWYFRDLSIFHPCPENRPPR
jgi:hypothetical protein